MISKRTAVVSALTAAVGAGLVVTATGAQAVSTAYGWVAAGGQLCVVQNANTKVRGEASVASPGLVLRLRKTGGATVVTSAPANVVGVWAGEGRPELGNFYGSGQYQLCANNNGATSVYVNYLTIKSDAEFS